jgi:hypothetical protein
VTNGAAEQIAQAPQIEDAEHLGLVDGALGGAVTELGGEVEESAGDGGAGDAVDGGLVLPRERAAAVHDDPGALAARAARNRDVDRTAIVRS